MQVQLKYIIMLITVHSACVLFLQVRARPGALPSAKAALKVTLGGIHNAPRSLLKSPADLAYTMDADPMPCIPTGCPSKLVTDPPHAIGQTARMANPLGLVGYVGDDDEESDDDTAPESGQDVLATPEAAHVLPDTAAQAHAGVHACLRSLLALAAIRTRAWPC